jgi:glycosyltransferase involved in cell wall biosynthesis
MAANIHLIRTRYPHWGAYSGINQFLKYIDRYNYNVEVRLASDGDEDFPIQNSAIRDWLRDTVQKRGMQWYKLSDLAAEIEVFLQCLHRKIDIIHYLDGEHSAQFLPRLPKQLGKVRPKMVATYHQSAEMLDSLIIKDVITRLDCITVVSPEQVSYFRQFVTPGKIHLILHGIDTDYFRPGSKPKEKGSFKCMTVGYWFRDFKAVRQVAERLAPYKEIEFHVVVSKLTGLEDLANVTLYKDHIADARLLEQYQQSDILFMPLVQSTANNSLLEGIACGLPVVSTYLPSVKAYLPGKEAILIKDNDPRQLADAILHLVHNPGVRKNMGREARRRAEELDWRNIAPQYEAIYSKLTSNYLSTHITVDVCTN